MTNFQKLFAVLAVAVVLGGGFYLNTKVDANAAELTGRVTAVEEKLDRHLSVKPKKNLPVAQEVKAEEPSVLDDVYEAVKWPLVKVWNGVEWVAQNTWDGTKYVANGAYQVAKYPVVKTYELLGGE